MDYVFQVGDEVEIVCVDNLFAIDRIFKVIGQTAIITMTEKEVSNLYSFANSLVQISTCKDGKTYTQFIYPYCISKKDDFIIKGR